MRIRFRAKFGVFNRLSFAGIFAGIHSDVALHAVTLSADEAIHWKKSYMALTIKIWLD